MTEPVKNIDIFPQRLGEALGDAHAFNLDLQRREIVSAPTLARYLKGDRIPDALVLARLASYLEVSADYLLGLSSVKKLPARWVYHTDGYRCSHCSNKGIPTYRYCPTCGKEMNIERDY